ncbi:MAG: tetratricopeptide repeat protein, partial [Actinomycetes bacterium]
GPPTMAAARDGAQPRRNRAGRRLPTAAGLSFAGMAVAAALVFRSDAAADLADLRRDAAAAIGASDCRSAVGKLGEILERESHDVEVRKRLAGCYRVLGRYGDAERELSLAVRDDPTAGTYFELANVRLSLGRRAEAWKAIETGAVAARTPDELAHASALARNAGNPALAKEILERVDPPRRDDRWLADYAAAATAAGDPDYLERYRQAIDAAPEGRRPRLLVELADAHAERGRLGEALAAYLAVPDNAPGVDQRHRNTRLGDLYFQLNQPVEAATAYQRALDAAVQPGDTPRLRLSLARALVKANLADRARSTLDALVASGETDPSTRVEAEALRRAIG